MRVSVEILDHIFSFLVSHQRTLIACSKDPVLFPIIERQLYYHTTVYFAEDRLDCKFEPESLSKLVSENPRIVNYVRILQIQVETDHRSGRHEVILTKLDDFAETLLMFPLLECIILSTPKNQMWRWPKVFRAALEDRFSLPTVREAHIVGCQDLPFSFIGDRKNIENLLLSGSLGLDEDDDGPAFLRLKSLTLSGLNSSVCADDLDKIDGLQSLKCSESSVDNLSEWLEICPETLNKLDIDLTYTKCEPQFSFKKGQQMLQLSTEILDGTKYSFRTGKVDDISTESEFLIPRNLQLLSIRAPVVIESEIDEDGIFTPKLCWSYLPAVSDIVTSSISPPNHLILDINIHLFDFPSNLANIDFSPLSFLGAATMSIPRIDLYVHTDILPSSVTFAHILSSLADYENVMRSIEAGILFIHSEKTAPDYVED